MMQPGEYCVVVTMEFQQVDGALMKSYSMFTINIIKAQTRLEISELVVKESVRMTRERAAENGDPSNLYGNHIPIFISIEPN